MDVEEIYIIRIDWIYLLQWLAHVNLMITFGSV